LEEEGGERRKGVVKRRKGMVKRKEKGWKGETERLLDRLQ
jgi:hypothetical protein